jgi:hypothetical protein
MHHIGDVPDPRSCLNTTNAGCVCTERANPPRGGGAKLTDLFLGGGRAAKGRLEEEEVRYVEFVRIIQSDAKRIEV